MVMSSGMAHGAGISYDRLEDVVAELQAQRGCAYAHVGQGWRDSAFLAAARRLDAFLGRTARWSERGRAYPRSPWNFGVRCRELR